MMAVDGYHNGWRYIVLPMAHSDELVMTAVLAVSSFHQSANEASVPLNRTPSNGDLKHLSPQFLYDVTIKGLQQRRNLIRSSYEEKQSTLITILVLLVGAMVTGRDDYPTILDMLQSATSVLGGEDQLGATEIGGFLVRQVRKWAIPHSHREPIKN